MTSPHAIGHVGLTVSDLDRAVEWYTAVFDWRLLSGPLTVSSTDARIAAQLADVFGAAVEFRQAHLLDPDGVAIELFEFRQPPTTGRGGFPFSQIGWTHLCVVTPNIDAAIERIHEAGGTQRTEVRPIFPGEPYRFCYCEDPFGNQIELATHAHAEAFAGRVAY